MVGAMLGFAIALIAVVYGDHSPWWLLGGTAIGFVLECLVRLGAGEEVGDIVGNAVTTFANIDIGDSGGGGDDYSGGGGDCGGCSGGDGGGGGGGD